MTYQPFGQTPTYHAPFRVGDVFSRSFGVYGRNFLPFSVITAILSSPSLGFQLASARIDPKHLAPGELGPSFFLLLLGSAAVGLFLRPLAQAAVLHGAFQDMRGRPVRWNESVGVAASRLLPIIGTSLLTGLFFGLALLLFVIPGIMVAVSAAVAVPACLVESLGPYRSFKRSQALTLDHRWQIFGIFIVLGIAGGMVGGVTSTAFTLSLGREASVLLSFPIISALQAFGAVVSVVIYHDLRVAKEGLDTDRIASVFD